MFEMIVGYPPFYSDDPLTTCRKIVNWRMFLKFPDEIQVGMAWQLPAGVKAHGLGSPSGTLQLLAPSFWKQQFFSTYYEYKLCYEDSSVVL